MSPLVFVLTQFAILAYAVLGGVFLAFSNFIMRALALTSATGGIEAMQVINREVFRWVFMTLFLGMAAISAFIMVHSALYLAGGPGTLILVGALVYLFGCFAITVIFNVPMNQALADMDLSAEATRDFWTGTYLPRWTMWNTIRMLACILAATMMLFGLVWFTQSQTRLA